MKHIATALLLLAGTASAPQAAHAARYWICPRPTYAYTVPSYTYTTVWVQRTVRTRVFTRRRGCCW
ncbi:MAG: hypothetical protein JO019_04285 [Candidatus Kaiserbacteria bacterium]|nr:hypothetical protein [Candidatus Kaiserbacteria bacterium]